MRRCLVAFALLVPASLYPCRSGFAQAPRPLEKIELIRLLTNPLFAQTEVAEIVRRSCVDFRPTERDWADLRNVGAGGEVIASVAACDTRRSGSRPASVPAAAAASPRVAAPVTPAPLTPLLLTGDVVATAGSPSVVRVFVHRAGVPQARVPLMLRGTTALGMPLDAVALSDDSGLAEFQLPPMRQISAYRFEVVGNGGVPFRNRPTVAFAVKAAEPARLLVTPDYVSASERTVKVTATLSDSLGNPIRGEPVELSSVASGPISITTDSAGRSAFTLPPGALPRGGVLRIRVRALPPVEVAVADAAGLSGAATRFAPLALGRHGRVGSALGEPLIFQARTVQGDPARGRLVRFHAVNARVSPDSAMLDSSGSVALDVVFGARAGDALVVARIDSVEKLLTVPVDPGPIVSLVLEYNGKPATGRRILVPVATPFQLRLTAHDFYGNETSIAALGQMLRAGRAQSVAHDSDLELLNLEVSEAVVLITLQARRFGIYDFTIGSGITASLRVQSIRGS